MTTMISRDLIEEILESYFPDINILDITEISEGLTNYNFKIIDENGRSYFLKIFRTANIQRVKGIVNLTGILKKYNFPTPGIIETINQTAYWTGGNKSAILTEYINGSYPGKNIQDLYQIGSVLGALHLIPPVIPLEKNYPLNYRNQSEALINSGEVIEDDLQLLLQRTSPLIKKLDNTGFPESIIHGDVFLDNLLLSEFGDIYFIDFEGGCLDKSIFDLARAVIGCCIIHNRIDINLAKALISGYDLVRTLEDQEREYLYEYIVYAGVVSTLWRYNEFRIKRKNENKGYLYRKLMNPVIDFLSIKKDYFNNLIFGNGN